MKIHRPSKLKAIIINICTILALIFSLSTLFLIVQTHESLKSIVHAEVISTLNGWQIKLPQDGRTPVAGIDYPIPKDGTDGEDGTNGQDSVSTHTKETIVEKETQQLIGPQGPKGDTGEKGDNGLTPVMRCNTKRDWFEVSYDNLDNWEALVDQDGNPVPCIVNK